ncbi:hypothetical protein ES703_39964 [subsurface metagenome]
MLGAPVNCDECELKNARRMTYTQAKACINELDREGLEKLLKDYGEEVIKTAFGCGISPRELQAVCRWLER